MSLFKFRTAFSIDTEKGLESCVCVKIWGLAWSLIASVLGRKEEDSEREPSEV